MVVWWSIAISVLRVNDRAVHRRCHARRAAGPGRLRAWPARRCHAPVPAQRRRRGPARLARRSEEHTSELQSQSNLVCRLLLEKKKKTRIYPISMTKTKKNHKI